MVGNARESDDDHRTDPDAGDADAGFDSEFDLGALERAQAAVDRLKEVYIADWGPAALADMYEALARIGRPGAASESSFQAFYRLAHDMKGQGGTFGYPLLTHIGEVLCRMTADRRDAGETEVGVLRAHLDAARRIMMDRIEGDGGAEGDRLVRDLQTLARLHLH
jgi:hypothetical protein